MKNGDISFEVVASDPMMALRRKLVKKLGKNIKIQPTTLRLENQLTPTKVDNNFQISQKDVGRNARPLERRLETTDGFVCAAMSVGVYKQNSVFSATAEYSGNSLLYYYPDPTIFAQAATATDPSEAAALLAIWNGNYGIKSNAEEIIYEDSLLPYLVTPQTQLGSFTGAQPSQGAYKGEQRIPFSMPIIFEGSKKNEILFRPAQGANVALIAGDTASSEQNYMAILLYGFLLRDYSQSASVNQALQMMIEEGYLTGAPGFGK